MSQTVTSDAPRTKDHPIQHEIRRIGILSAAKTFLVIGGACGFVGGLMQWFFLQSIISYGYSAAMEGDLGGMSGFPDVFGIIGSLAWILPLIGGVAGSATGIVMGVVVALVYNLASRVWGGIELELRRVGPTPITLIVPAARQGEATPLPGAPAPMPTPPPHPQERTTSPPPASHFFE
jgi:hypothetical protein